MSARLFCVGHAVEDHVFDVAAMPREATKHQAKGFQIVGGGPAANAAVAAARLGGEASIAARVGDDAVGASIIADLEREGVDCIRMRRCRGAASSVSAVMVDPGGERMIVNYLDTDLPTDAAWLIDAFPTEVDAVLADVRWPAGAVAALDAARARGLPGVLDADLPAPDDARLYAAASHVAFSAEAARRYADADDLTDAVKEARRRLNAWVCATDGENGVLIAEANAVRRVPGFAVKTVDTLGAGDVWHGAFALRLAEGAGEEEAARFANAAAAVKVTRAGGRAGAPTRQEVDALLGAEQLLETSA